MFNSETILLSPPCKSITIENHVIGYKKEGESTVVFLKQDDKVILSMVIDSYQTSINETINLLESNSVKYIDYLVWTHPHRDHSEGIDLLLKKFCNKNSKVIIPNIDTGSFEDIPDNCAEKYNFFSKINLRGANKNGKIIYGEFNNFIKKYNFIWNNDSFDLTICCLTPTSKMLANNKFNKSNNINDYSVSVVINFNGKIFVYGADIENKAIHSLKEEQVYLDNIVFVKAPHHGSNSTSEIFDVIEISENTICAITNYLNGNIILPENDMIDQYNTRSNEVYLFNKNIDEEYGIVSSYFDMHDINKIIYDVKSTGIAYNYCNEK